MNTIDFLTPTGISVITTFLIGAFKIKQNCSSLLTNIITIVLAVILTAIGSLSLTEFNGLQSIMLILKNGIESGLMAIGFYEGYKHITEKKDGGTINGL